MIELLSGDEDGNGTCFRAILAYPRTAKEASMYRSVECFHLSPR